jgi:hypothetical protein
MRKSLALAGVWLAWALVISVAAATVAFDGEDPALGLLPYALFFTHSADGRLNIDCVVLAISQPGRAEPRRGSVVAPPLDPLSR